MWSIALSSHIVRPYCCCGDDISADVGDIHQFIRPELDELDELDELFEMLRLFGLE